MFVFYLFRFSIQFSASRFLFFVPFDILTQIDVSIFDDVLEVDIPS